MAYRFKYLTTAAVSSVAPRRWSYDVFISFRGEDTRNTFTGYLYRNLHQRGINTFIDDEELRRGQQIGPALLKAIKESRIAIIIFSPDYASSSWCLDELAKIVECSESNGQILIPVFYNVERSDVQNHRGTFGEALEEHEKKFREIRENYVENMEKLQKWKAALYKASIAEEHQLKLGDEARFVERICKDISGRVGRLFLHVARYPVGIDTRLNELNALLSIGSQDVRMIGIWGTGGIGKTTLAKATFNFYAEDFEGGCFLGNVREASQQYRGLIHLQQLLVSKILGYSEVQFDDVNSGKYLIMTRLRNKKVLIVLDDVDHLDQLDALAGSDNWFGSGSRIIVTTRDEHLLVVRGEKRRYKMKELQHDEALELLSWNAFGTPCPPEDYRGFFDPLMYYAMGLPLALTTLGSFLRDQSIAHFEGTIEKLKVSPQPEIYNVLKVSYDGLGDHEKAIFLDIACFFHENDKDYVMEVLRSCDLFPDIGIEVLVERSLVTVESKKLQMHNLVQQMGWEIVRQESPNPGKRSRLWLHEDVLHVLEENTGTSAIKGIMVDLPEIKEIWLNANAFKAMKRLRLLLVRNADFSCGPNYLPNELRWLEWSGYPSSTLPFDFCPKKLAGLKLTFGRITRLWDGFKSCASLSNLELSECKSLLEVPDVSTLPCLEKLTVFECNSLVKLHESVGFLDKLVSLNIQYCSSLCILPSKLRLSSLREVFLVGCKSLKKFPDILGMMENVHSLEFHFSGIEELPPSIENLTGLNKLSFSQCNNLQSLPSSIYNLRNLDNLSLSGCKMFRGFPDRAENQRHVLHHAAGESALVVPSCSKSLCCFPEAPSSFSKMETLNLMNTDIVTLPHGICNFFHLRNLFLFRCKQLKEILELPPYLAYLAASHCSSLEMVQTSNLQLANRITIDLFGCHKLCKEDVITKLLHRVNLTEIDFPNGESRIVSGLDDWGDSWVFYNLLFSVIQPGNDIPNLFLYQIMGWNQMHFKVDSSIFGKLDGVAVCAVFCLDRDCTTSSTRYDICINGNKMEGQSITLGHVDEDHMSADHVWAAYFRLPKHLIEEYVRDGWNSVEVSFSEDLKIKKCGAHFVSKENEINGSTGVEFCSPDYVSKKLPRSRHTYKKRKNGAWVGLGLKLRIFQFKMTKMRKRKTFIKAVSSNL